jgi:adenylate cyclase
MRAAALVLLLPLAGFALLLATTPADVHWEHRPTHFWLILLTALVNVVLGLAASEAARRRRDARALLVSLAFLVSAGFLGLHALATPGALIEGRSVGFVIATPIGLIVASGFAAASAVELPARTAAWVVANDRLLRGAVLALIGAWAFFSVAELPPFDGPLPPGELHGPLLGLAAVGVPLFVFAAWRYFELYRRRQDPLPAALTAAWVLLAEALLTIGASRSWHLSWWEWHVLMAAAFALVAWTARQGYRREASVTAAFEGVYLDATVRQLDRRSGTALRRLVQALEADRPVEPVVADLRREGMSSDEAALLERSAREVKRIDELFRPYVSPALAETLERRPELAGLGGTEREVTVLFADLQQFTTYSERRSPGELISMLNAYWAAAVPVLLEEGGTVERFAGDSVMAVWNVLGDQPDHAQRGLLAAARMVRASQKLADERPGWPRFRAGLATGPAAVGHVGTDEQRSFAAIGDTTNLAARLQALGRPGQIVVAGSTASRLPDTSILSPAETRIVRGRQAPVETFLLEPT